MSGPMRRAKRHAIMVLTLVIALALGAASQAQSRQDLFRLALENRLAELLVDLNLTPAQLAELRTVVLALKQAREGEASKAASLLQERKAAVLSGDADQVKKIDQELRELSSVRLSDIPEAESFLDGLTERQRQVLASLLGEAAVVARPSGSRQVLRLPAPPEVLIERFDGRGFGFRVILPQARERGPKEPVYRLMPGWPLQSGDRRLDVILDLIDEMLS